MTGVQALTNLVRSEPIDLGNQVRVTRRFDAKARKERQGWYGITAPPGCKCHNASFV
jgi:hypothetical protein